jgi:hypothetical protein
MLGSEKRMGITRAKSHHSEIDAGVPRGCIGTARDGHNANLYDASCLQ